MIHSYIENDVLLPESSGMQSTMVFKLKPNTDGVKKINIKADNPIYSLLITPSENYVCLSADGKLFSDWGGDLLVRGNDSNQIDIYVKLRALDEGVQENEVSLNIEYHILV